MTVAFRAAGSVSANLASQPIAVPSGTAAGDFMVAVLNLRETTRTVTGIPSGWVEIAGSPVTGPGGTFIAHVYTKAAVSGDIGSSPTWTISSQTRCNLAIYSASGSTNVFDGTAFTANSGTAGLSVTLNPPGSPTVADGDLLLGVAACEGSVSNDQPALTAPTGWALRTQTTGTGAGVNNAALGLFDLTQTTHGTVSSATATSSKPVWSIGGILAIAAPINATVTGPVAGIALAAPAGSLAIDVRVTGTTAGIAAAAPAGSVVINSRIAGPVAATSLAAPAGTVSVGAVLAGPAGSVTIAAPAGTLNVAARITGPVAALSVAGLAGSVAVTSAGSAAAVALTAPAGAVASSSSATVSGPTSGITIAAPAGTVDARTAVTLLGPTAPLTVTAQPGSITTGLLFSGPSAALTAAAPDGQVLITNVVTIAGMTAALVISAPPGRVGEPRNITLTAGHAQTVWAPGQGKAAALTVGSVTSTPVGAGHASDRFTTDNPTTEWTTP